MRSKLFNVLFLCLALICMSVPMAAQCPTMPVPPISNIGSTTATVSWGTYDTSVSKVRIMLRKWNQPVVIWSYAIRPVAELSYTFPNLQPSTLYEVRTRTMCSKSPYLGTISQSKRFTTLSANISIPTDDAVISTDFFDLQGRKIGLNSIPIGSLYVERRTLSKSGYSAVLKMRAD